MPASDFDPRISVHDIASALAQRLVGIAKGRDDADAFHRCVAGNLEILFYPALICQNIETRIHNGRKRIDITFENAADTGFFKPLHASQGIPCPYIAVERKNYSADPGNPEVDQLYARLSPNRGKVGIFVCREIKDFDLLLTRCKDVFKDSGSLLVPLLDGDLLAMLREVDAKGHHPYESLLAERARVIRMG